MDSQVVDYIAAISSPHRALFDRVHRLILEACPDADVTLAYNMPTYRVGKQRLHVAAWAHGISIYGWKAHGDGGLTTRHPELKTSTGTIRLPTDHAAEIADEEIRRFVRTALLSEP